MRKLSEEEIARVGPVVAIINDKPGEEKSLLACWDGSTIRVVPKDITWDEVSEHFFDDARPTLWPEHTKLWREPDFSKWELYILDGLEPTEGLIFFICFDKGQWETTPSST